MFIIVLKQSNQIRRQAHIIEMAKRLGIKTEVPVVASIALGGVNVQSCKKADGPTGSGHVKITFAPNGSVSSAVVDSGPFPGTPVGGCIAGKFRGARVPAFSGGPVSVGKSFTVN